MKFYIITNFEFIVHYISNMIKQLLGKRIKEIRKAKKLTQEQLAEFVGIETSSISNIENGRYFPTAENLDKIMQVLQITPLELFIVEHNCENDFLIEELSNAMKTDSKLTKLMYKFYMTIKY